MTATQSLGASSRSRARSAEGVVRFARELSWTDVPLAVRRHLAWLLLDFASVCAASRVAQSATIAAEFASVACRGVEATSLLDGRRLSAPGAAWANGVLANALDFDDGHRLTKGHPSAIIVPAALAVGEAVDARFEDFLLATLVGYEVSIRAGIDLHARESQYHASGAWGGIGAAAAASRLLALDDRSSTNALGIAEYHGPIAPMMRAIADPAMTKDTTGWGAFIGVTSAMLAERSFTGPSTLSCESFDTRDLGEEWAVLDMYVKPYPCCRWAHPALDATLRLRSLCSSASIASVEIHTFEAAEAMSRRKPESTEEMQYSLIWPVAVAFVRGQFGVEEVTIPTLDDEHEIIRVASSISTIVNPEFNAAFPSRRYARVIVHTTDGRTFDSGRVEARGEPEDPRWSEVIEVKARTHLGANQAMQVVGDLAPPVTTLGHRGATDLMSLLAWGWTGGVALYKGNNEVVARAGLGDREDV